MTWTRIEPRPARGPFATAALCRRLRSSDAGITVTPRTQRVPATGNGLRTVHVRVASGAALRLVQYGGSGVFGDSTGPSIVTTADGWHFDRP